VSKSPPLFYSRARCLQVFNPLLQLVLRHRPSQPLRWPISRNGEELSRTLVFFRNTRSYSAFGPPAFKPSARPIADARCARPLLPRAWHGAGGKRASLGSCARRSDRPKAALAITPRGAPTAPANLWRLQQPAYSAQERRSGILEE
jgi:hypothetical protein